MVEKSVTGGASFSLSGRANGAAGDLKQPMSYCLATDVPLPAGAAAAAAAAGAAAAQAAAGAAAP